MDVLFIAYHFPPTGGAGTQRSAKLARHLPDNGIDVTVLAGPGPSGQRWEPVDRTLESDIPDTVVVHRVSRGDWPGELERALPSMLNRERPEAVLVTLSPYPSLAPTLEAAQAAGTPVVADLRDPWALDETKKYPTRWQRRRARAKMGALLSRCAAVIMNTHEAGSAVRSAFPDIDADRVFVVPNGFDPEDLEVPPARFPEESFTIVHTGYLHAELARQNERRALAKRIAGGWLWPVDIGTRSHVHLVGALHRLDPELRARTQVILAGRLTDTDREIVAASPMASRFEMPGYVTHAEAIALMRGADALFLPLHDIPAGRRSRIVPGKTYEYLASRTPIVAAVPDGDARDLIQGMHAGIACSPSDELGIARALTTIALDPAPFSRARPGLDRYRRSEIAASIAGILRFAAGRTRR